MDSLPNDGTQSQGDAARRKRATHRVLYSLYAIVVGILVMAWFSEYTIKGVPAQYAAWTFIAVGVLGLLGVNVFRGGPLDKRLDQQPAPSDKDIEPHQGHSR